MSVDRGVPQDSILGPIPFLVYINDIVNSGTKLKFVMYADDTNLLFKDKNIDSLRINISELNSVKIMIIFY